jgi:hypothetical protein
MLKIVIIAAAAAIAALVGFRRSREWLLEEVKAFTDLLLLRVLRWSSRFGSELSPDGQIEQMRWRNLRLRDLRGLMLRSKERQRRAAGQGGSRS